MSVTEQFRSFYLVLGYGKKENESLWSADLCMPVCQLAAIP